MNSEKNLSKISGVKFTWRLLFRKALRPVFIIVTTVCKISTRSFGYFWVLVRCKYYQSYSEKKFTDISVAKSVLIQSFTLKTLTNVLPKACFLINSQKQVEKCLHKKLSKEQPPWTLFILGQLTLIRTLPTVKDSVWLIMQHMRVAPPC